LAAPTTECDNPNALGVSRKVEIDTTGGPGFGFQHFKYHDFLRDHEIVLTFDDGPWAGNTPAVLKSAGRPMHQGGLFSDRQGMLAIIRKIMKTGVGPLAIPSGRTPGRIWIYRS